MPVSQTVCKFKCTQVNPTTPDSESQNVELRAEYDPNSDEDTKFSKWTPTGLLQTTISNPNVLGFFEVGKSYYITVSPAD